MFFVTEFRITGRQVVIISRSERNRGTDIHITLLINFEGTTTDSSLQICDHYAIKASLPCEHRSNAAQKFPFDGDLYLCLYRTDLPKFKLQCNYSVTLYHLCSYRRQRQPYWTEEANQCREGHKWLELLSFWIYTAHTAFLVANSRVSHFLALHISFLLRLFFLPILFCALSSSFCCSSFLFPLYSFPLLFLFLFSLYLSVATHFILFLSIYTPSFLL